MVHRTHCSRGRMRSRDPFSLRRPIIVVRPPEPRRSFVPRESKPLSALLPNFETEAGWKRLAGEDVAEMTEEALRTEAVAILDELDRLRDSGEGPRLYIIAGVVGRVDITDQAWLQHRSERLNTELDRRRSVGGRHVG